MASFRDVDNILDEARRLGYNQSHDEHLQLIASNLDAIHQAAEQGNGRAMWELGAYEAVTGDWPTARAWFMRADQSSEPEVSGWAFFSLLDSWRAGGDRNGRQAYIERNLERLIAAARSGAPQAQYQLGFWESEVLGHFDKAIAYWKAAAAADYFVAERVMQCVEILATMKVRSWRSMFGRARQAAHYEGALRTLASLDLVALATELGSRS